MSSTGQLLTTLVQLRTTFQKNRVAFNNRIAAVERGSDQATPAGERIYHYYHDRFLELERDLSKDIEQVLDDLSLPIIDHLLALKGVGPVLAAKVVAPIDIRRAETVSALWRYCGYGVVDGKRERPVKGQRLAYNKTLKIACRMVGESFMKASSPYRALYDEKRAYYEANREWTKGHVHNAALGFMIKIWLSHLWVRWRTLEGLDTRAPYVFEKLGHTHRYPAEDFGWPPLNGAVKSE